VAEWWCKLVVPSQPQQTPSAAGDDNAALLQHVGGQFEQGTTATKGENIATVAVDLQHSPTTEEHGPMQNPEELTTNDTGSARNSGNQHSSGEMSPNEVTGVYNGGQSATPISGPSARVTEIHVEQPGAIQYRPWHEVDLVSGQDGTTSSKDLTESLGRNWSAATCNNSTSRDSSHEGRHPNSLT
jgi:hypothetical protein